jgi:phage tail sheath protein FI
MATYKTPGVYIEEIALFPPSVAQVETAIPAFIGYTEKAEKNGAALPTVKVTVGAGDVTVSEPVRISSLIEYTSYFGTGPKENLTIEVKDTLVPTTTTVAKRVITASGPDTIKHSMYYHMQMYFSNGGGPCYVLSVGDTTGGVSKDNLLAGLDVIGRYDEPTLLVFPQGNSLGTASDLYDVYDTALLQAADLKDRFVVMDCYGDDYKTLRAADGVGTINLKYGGAYHPYLKTGLNFIYDKDNQTIVHKKDPEADGTFVDGDFNGKKLSEITSNELKEQVKGEIANQARVTLPPCSSVVGVYAAIDSTRGVWKAPANVSLNIVNAPSKNITDRDQEDMNIDVTAGKSVNAIRAFTGKGTLIWGARTLAGNDNEWRYVSVRRFFNMVEESVKKATYQFVFEPNDANTWVKVRAMIENYLTVLWRQGALAGAKPEQAFYVKVGLNITMTAQDILEGYMNVEIGMAVVRPAEFIVLKFSHKMQES